MPHYILIETINEGTFFADEGSRRRYFEIYKLSEEQENNLISLLNGNAPSIIFEAKNQADALRKIGHLYKFADKNYYERILPLKV